MSLALGDISAESMKALAAQGGSELGEVVDRIKAMALAAEDHGEEVIDSVETKTQGDIAEDLNTLLSGIKDIVTPILALLNEIKDRGILISLPPTK